MVCECKDLIAKGIDAAVIEAERLHGASQNTVATVAEDRFAAKVRKDGREVLKEIWTKS